MADHYKFKDFSGLKERLNTWIDHQRVHKTSKQVADLMGYASNTAITKLPGRLSIRKDAIRRICEASKGEFTLDYFLKGRDVVSDSSPSRTNAFLQQLATAEGARSHQGVIISLEKECARGRPRLNFETKEQYQLMKRTIGETTFKIPCAMLSRSERINLGCLDPVNRAIPDAENDPFVLNKKLVAEGTNIKLKNNPIYTISLLEDDEKKRACTIKGAVSDYFSFLKVHSSMEVDFLEAIARGKSSTKRDEFLRNANAKTNVAVSISTLLVYEDRETKSYRALVHKRSDQPAMYAGLRAIIPGGMFQPEFADDKPALEWNICYGIIKEYGEELFSEKIPENTFWRPSSIFSRWESARNLRDALLQGRCKLIHSGVVLNLLNLGLEISTVLLMEANWFNELQFDWNLEYVPRENLKASYGKKGVITDYDLRNFDKEFKKEFRESHKSPISFAAEWVPDSLASLWLGIDATTEYLNGKRSAVAVEHLLPDWAMPGGKS